MNRSTKSKAEARARIAHLRTSAERCKVMQLNSRARLAEMIANELRDSRMALARDFDIAMQGGATIADITYVTGLARTTVQRYVDDYRADSKPVIEEITEEPEAWILGGEVEGGRAVTEVATGVEWILVAGDGEAKLVDPITGALLWTKRGTFPDSARHLIDTAEEIS